MTDAGPAIEVQGLAKTFGDVVALNGVDLTVAAGTVFGLLGPNGAGKTTLVRVLATLLIPSAGRASVLGHDVVSEPLAVRRRIGLAGQFAAVDAELTGRENLEMIGRLYRLRAGRRAGEPARCSSASTSGTRPTAGSATYSGGMRRRLDLGAGLIGRPPVVLLDEPTTGLDPRSRSELWRASAQLRETGTTVLLTTQYLEEADRLAQQIAVVDRGTDRRAGDRGAAQGDDRRPRCRRSACATRPARRGRANAGRPGRARGAVGGREHAARSASPSPIPAASAEAIRRLDARPAADRRRAAADSRASTTSSSP